MVYKAYFNFVDQLPQPSSQPSHFPVALLQASKTIYAEAGLVYYREYPFATSSYSGRSSHGYDDDRVPLGSLTPSWGLQSSSEVQLDFPSGTEAILFRDVSKIFTKYHKDLPKWLFGAPYLRNRLTFRSVKTPLIPGYEIARNLRQIGRQNAVEIRSLRINVPRKEWEHLHRACYELPLYSTIIKQHMYNVREIVLGKSSVPHIDQNGGAEHWLCGADRTCSTELGSALQCLKFADSHSQLNIADPWRCQEAFNLKHLILKHIRSLILNLSHIRSVEVVANCPCFPTGFLRSCEAEIFRTLKERSAAASAQ